MHSAITIFPTPAMFDTGRQPLTSIHSNTPKTITKTKRSVKGRKADSISLPPATGTHTKVPTNCVGACDLSADDDIPLALLKQLLSASLATCPSTLQPETTIRWKAVQLDVTSESPLTRLFIQFAPSPTPQQVPLHHPRVEPKMPALQVIPVRSKKAAILYPVGPFKPMMCIVPDCPHDWHIHVHSANPLIFPFAFRFR